MDVLGSSNKDLKDALVLKIREALRLKKYDAELQKKNLELETWCMYPSVLFLY